MQVTTLLDKMGHIAQFFVTFTVVAAFLGTIYLLLISPVELPSGTRELLSLLVGVLTSAFKDVVGYFFGSSLGSARKEQQSTVRTQP
jgi:CDP-diglyceride synthetase